MSDTKKPEETTTTGASGYAKAKPGQDDYGKIVEGAAGEPMSGTVSDITDGDSHKHHPKKHK